MNLTMVSIDPPSLPEVQASLRRAVWTRLITIALLLLGVALIIAMFATDVVGHDKEVGQALVVVAMLLSLGSALYGFVPTAKMEALSPASFNELREMKRLAAAYPLVDAYLKRIPSDREILRIDLMRANTIKQQVDAQTSEKERQALVNAIRSAN